MVCFISEKVEMEVGLPGRNGPRALRRAQTKDRTMLQEKPDPGHAQNRLLPTAVTTVSVILQM